MTAVMAMSRVDEVLEPEVRGAWLEYLDSLHGLPVDEYEDVEPHAWMRLTQKLEQLRARKRALQAPARRTNAAEGGSPAGETGHEGPPR